jgi:hypothetical protein
MYRCLCSGCRDDSADIAGRIYDRLVKPLGSFERGDVFKDVDSIPFGVNFKKYLDSMVTQCAVQLVIIGPQWLDITVASGQVSGGKKPIRGDGYERQCVGMVFERVQQP